MKAAAEENRIANQRADFLTNCVNPLIRLLTRLAHVVIAIISGRAMLNGATIEIAEEVLSYFVKSAPYGVCRAACAATAQYLYMNVSLDETLADEEALRRRNVEIRKINFPQITEEMLKEAKEKLAGIERPSALDIQRALSVGCNVAVKLRRLIVDGGEKRD